MFQANKIRAHLKLLEHRRTRIAAYLDDVVRSLPAEQILRSMTDRKRIVDIERSLERIDQQIDGYRSKLAHIESLGRD